MRCRLRPVSCPAFLPPAAAWRDGRYGPERPRPRLDGPFFLAVGDRAAGTPLFPVHVAGPAAGG